MQHLQPNATLQGGKYKIEKVLGQGGFGITYLAEHAMLGGMVAIKEFFFKDCCEREEGTTSVIVPTKSNTELVDRFKQKFVKEARTIFALSHPNIVSIHDLFEENGTAYYVMEYIKGESLNDKVKTHGKMPLQTALVYITKVAEALKYLHSKNIAHLDIKPSNLMVRMEDNDIRVIDFGLSKQYDGETGGQTSTTPVGISTGYAPIEQYRQGGVSTFSPQTDIYSLAATLFKLITGNTPPEPMSILDEGLPELPVDIPQHICDAIEKGMEIKKNKRPESVEEWLSMLDFSNNKEEQKKTLQESLSCDESTMLVDRLMQYAGNSKLDEEEDATVLINNHSSNVIDLGLSVNWCTCNLGATMPLSHGNFYVLSSLKNLESESANGLRLPTKEEWNELINKCEHKWTDSNFVEFCGMNGETLAIPVCGRLYDNEQDQLHETAFYWAAPNKYENKLWFARMTEKDASANNVIARTKTNVAMSIRLVQDK